MAASTCVSARLSDIPDDISEHYLPYPITLRQRQRADLFSREQYIQSVRLFRGSSGFDVHGTIFRSQAKTEKPHSVHLSIDPTKKTVTDAFCTCKAGLAGQCAHVLAIIWTMRNWILAGLKDIPAESSCTSSRQQWDRPRGQKIPPEPVSSMIISKPGNVNKKRKPIMAIFEDNRKVKALQAANFQYLHTHFKDCAIGYLAQETSDTVATQKGPQFLGSTLASQLPLMEHELLPLTTSLVCGDVDFPKTPVIAIPPTVSQQQHEWSHLNLTLDDARALVKATQEQATCSLWHTERKKRITASVFRRCMTRKNPVSDIFLRNIFDSKPFFSVATSYGAVNEKIARQMYIKKSKLHVHSCGLVVNPHFPFLGASPDGKVCDNNSTGILEIKCPYSIRDMTFEEALQANRSEFCLERTDNQTTLKKGHLYIHQVQGQLLVTGAPFCDFVCYTKQDFHIQRVLPDNQMMYAMLLKLTDMYIKHVKDYQLKAASTSTRADSPQALQ